MAPDGNRADIEIYFVELHRALKQIETDEHAESQSAASARDAAARKCRAYVERQIAVWERHEYRLAVWAAESEPEAPNPFTPPLSAWDCAEIRLRLTGLLAPLKVAA